MNTKTREAIEAAVAKERNRCADVVKARMRLNSRGKPATMRDMWLSIVVDEIRSGEER